MKSNNFNIENPFEIHDTTLVKCWDSQSTHLVIPSEIQTIGSKAFAHCKNLQTITLPSSLKTIESYAFLQCESLQTLMLPESLLSLGTGVFEECHSLTVITIPPAVKEIPPKAFALCKSLQEIHLPQGLVSLGALAFSHCSALLSLDIPDSVTEMGNHAFAFSQSLITVHLPSELEEIKNNTFAMCHSLESVEIPPKVHTIGSHSFLNCPSITTLTFPDHVKRIEQSAFEGCVNLRRVRLPKHLAFLGTHSFHGCVALKKLTKGRSDVPCTLDTFSLPPLSQFDVIDRSLLELLSLKEQYDYCFTQWHLEVGSRKHSTMQRHLFSSPTLLHYALLEDSIPIITGILSEVEDLSLLLLHELIQTSIERRTTEITAHFLEYQKKHYTQEEIDTFQERMDMISMGFDLPTYEEFSQLWDFELEKGQISITGYRGLEKEVTIPKKLANGKNIRYFQHQHSTSTALTHLRIEADLWVCDLRGAPFPLESLEITGHIYTTVNCTQLSSLTHLSYEGRGHGDLQFICTSTALERFTIPEGVRLLDYYCFCHCHNLQSITIPPSVTDIRIYAFTNCSSVTVYGKLGSVADQYCEKVGIPFREMEEGNP